MHFGAQYCGTPTIVSPAHLRLAPRSAARRKRITHAHQGQTGAQALTEAGARSPARHARGASDYIMKLPKAEQDLEEWQTNSKAWPSK